MSTAVLDRPTTEPVEAPDDTIHWEFDCYPGESFCGINLRGHTDYSGRTDIDVNCQECRHLNTVANQFVLSCDALRAYRQKLNS